MKIKLDVSDERYPEIAEMLKEHGVETDDSADLVLSENKHFSSNLIVKDKATNERVILPVDEIVFIETYGHYVEVQTESMKYQVMGRLYKIADMLDPEKFLCISNSVVVAADKVKKISRAQSMKFMLTMSNGRNVDVTRSYYYAFKDRFNI